MVVDAHQQDLFERKTPSEKIIRCLQKEYKRLPDFHLIFIVLGDSLLGRFDITPSDDEYREATAIVDKLITFRDPD